MQPSIKILRCQGVVLVYRKRVSSESLFVKNEKEKYFSHVFPLSVSLRSRFFVGMGLQEVRGLNLVHFLNLPGQKIYCLTHLKMIIK